MHFSEPPVWYDAVYQPHFHPVYAGNPLIEVISEQYSEAEFLSFMTYLPSLPTHLFDMPYAQAQVYIKQLEKAYISSSIDYDIYRHVYNELVSGYVHRDPTTPDFQSTMLAVARGSDEYKPNPHEKKQVSSGSCSLLSGLSGIGKTEKVKAIMKMFPPVIRHHSYNDRLCVIDQIPTVSFEISNVKSMRAVALNFFKAVDALLGTDIAGKWIASKLGIHAHLIEMQQIAHRHGIGLVHIDECQKLLAAAKTPDSPTVSYLESLFNLIGVPILMTCTEDGRELFEVKGATDIGETPQFTTTRRLTSSRDIQCTRMGIDSPEYQQFIDCFLPESLFQNTPARSKAFRILVFSMTQGIHQVVNKLLRAFLENVHRRKTPPEEYETLLHNIFNSQFKLLKPALQALRDNDAQAYEMHKSKLDDEFNLIESSDVDYGKRKSRTLHTSKAGPVIATEKELGDKSYD